ncbi:hypothetical protein GCM10027416_23230 [Okibacterium endophyticum]
MRPVQPELLVAHPEFVLHTERLPVAAGLLKWTRADPLRPEEHGEVGYPRIMNANERF